MQGIDSDATPSNSLPQRTLVVQSDEAGLVVLANGKLTQWRPSIDRAKGRRLAHGWSLDRPIGNPVHDAFLAQSNIAVLTTLQDETGGAIATAVDLSTGEIVWQRPLGIAPTDRFVQEGSAIVVIDERGGMVRFDASARGANGRVAGQVLASPINGLTGSLIFVRTDEGSDAIVAPVGNAIVVRSGAIDERKLTLPSTLAGVPAIVQATMIAPLANGSLARIHIHDGKIETGPSWRAPGTGSDAKGIVIPIAGNRYLVTDGARRAMKLTWPLDRDYELDTASALELPSRAVRAVRDPVSSYAAILDAAGGITLIDTDRFAIVGKSTQAGRSVTAGPVFRDSEVVFVSGDREIESLSVPKLDRRWQFRDAALAGLPTTVTPIEYLVADQTGQLIRLHIESGKVTSTARTLAGAPAAAPLAFGDQWLVPMVDGTLAVVNKSE